MSSESSMENIADLIFTKKVHFHQQTGILQEFVYVSRTTYVTLLSQLYYCTKYYFDIDCDNNTIFGMKMRIGDWRFSDVNGEVFVGI